MFHKRSFFAAGTVALLAFAGMTACASMTQGTSSPRTYAAHGVSFRYPRGWHRGTPATSVGSTSSRLWVVALTPGRGRTVNAVVVSASRTGVVATRQNLPVITPTVVRVRRRELRQLHVELTARPRAITVGDMPGLRFTGTGKIFGAAAKVTEFSAFNGSTEYNITCSATPAKAGAIQQACTQVVRSFKVSKLFTPGTALVYRAHGVSFDYPLSWAKGTVPAGCARCKPWATAVGLDQINEIQVIAHGHQTRVTRRNLPQAKPYVTRAESRFYRHIGGRLLAGPQAITVGGLPGLRYRGTGNFDGTAVKDTEAVVFNGTTFYEIECTSTLAKANVVDRACAEVLRTFKVTQPSRRE
jgi:hypothetical protein